MSKHTLPKIDSTTVSIDGVPITFETGQMAPQASGAVVLRCGETVILSTACDAPSAPDIGFFPLKVDYREKMSAAGRTLGGFLKRENRLTERETLLCRLTDRSIRPMFPPGYNREVQVITTVFSYDGQHATDPLAICAATAALTISSIPLVKPVAAVRIGLIDHQFVINPTVDQMESSRLDMILSGTHEAILMIEGHCDFLTQEQLLEAIDQAHEAIKTICETLADWQQVVGKDKELGELRLLPDTLVEEVKNCVGPQLEKALHIQDKQQRNVAVKQVKDSLLETMPALDTTESAVWTTSQAVEAFGVLQSQLMRKMILDEQIRCDGRRCDQIRPITIDCSPLPRTHGSLLFTRGETQALAICTLGSDTMGQRYESLDSGDLVHHFYLQYSFPPYCVGEVGRMGPPGRREIGHGKLAERALLAVMPDRTQFPYTIRVESTILSSNGSSSQASVCGASLAMMLAGVPLKEHVAGIAMGLILDHQAKGRGDHLTGPHKERCAILSDIQGIEDALGDMDFKIAGNGEGKISAFQLDIKIEGINRQIMQAALAQATEGLIHIVGEMKKSCSAPNKQLSKHAPLLETLQIKPHQIAIVIGPGGKNIRAISENSGAEININDDGIVSIAASNAQEMATAKQMIDDLIAEAKVGEIYQGKIAAIKDFGLFVAIVGSKQGLCHISEISHEHIGNIYDLFKEGDPLEVKVLEINSRNGQIRLSHKATLPTPESG